MFAALIIISQEITPDPTGSFANSDLITAMYKQENNETVHQKLLLSFI